ncbi:hypothetical protein [Thalassotalea sp. SU-HH00458]|uniref:hypothetical protein n=1 Tax=Thalassotalea sp. SU-HH00458 TaxID=3127657 RepID=UPI00310B1C43
MKKIIVLVTLFVLLVAGYLSLTDEENTSLITDRSSLEIESEEQQIDVNQFSKQPDYRITIKSSDGEITDRDISRNIDIESEIDSTVSEESRGSHTTSSLDMFLTGEADFLFVDDTDELHQYLLNKWDGKAEFIEDGIYDIEVSVLGAKKEIILFEINHKQRAVMSAEEFRDQYLLPELAKFDSDSSYGEYSSSKELLVMQIADSISTSTEDIFIHSLTCYDLYCVFFVETANGELFKLFEQKIRAIDNAFLSLFTSRDNNNYGIFKLSFK